MARNKAAGDDRRVGAVKARSQIKNPITGTWTKRDDRSGKFLDVKADPKPFKGVRHRKTETSAEVMGRAVKRHSKLFKNLHEGPDRVREWHIPCDVVLRAGWVVVRARSAEEAMDKAKANAWDDVTWGATSELKDWTITGEPEIAG
jgi:hypothetical protein